MTISYAKVIIILMTIVYTMFVAYLCITTYKQIFQFEERLDDVVGKEKQKVVKERERLDKEDIQRNKLFLRLSGKSSDPVKEEPAKLMSSVAEAKLKEFFEESSKHTSQKNKKFNGY